MVRGTPDRTRLQMADHLLRNSVGRKVKGSAPDGRTTRHAGYAANLRVRKWIEEAYGLAKGAGVFARTRYRGLPQVERANQLTFLVPWSTRPSVDK